ncbi:MAG: GspE/PulE family protein [Candidatus Paceibacterota bacterium]
MEEGMSVSKTNSSDNLPSTVTKNLVTLSNTNFPFLELKPENVSSRCFELIDLEAAKILKAAPVEIIDDFTVTVALTDPSDLAAQDDIRYRLSGKEVNFSVVDEKQFDLLINRWSKSNARATETLAVKDLSQDDIKILGDDESSDSGPMATLVNKLLEQAVIQGASDVHVEPTDTNIEVRFRVDGVLHSHTSYPIHLGPGIVNRVKVMGRMPANHLAPQDGRFNRRYNKKDIDCRVVSLPTSRGLEGLVIRLLDQSRSRTSLEKIGFHEDLLERFKSVLELPHGMILVTGPTGSGKTTTLYASLGLVSKPDRKTLTIEDPVEIRLQSVTQLQVNEKQNLTFASALKSFLRADPDVMLVGEIRDSETAALAAQAALTGHLVLSTLHTNEAAGAVARLNNLGVEPFLLASSLKAVLAQRLLRKLCSKCALPYEPTEEELVMSKWPETLPKPEMLSKAKPNGCNDCGLTGYRGRIPVAELIVVNEEISESITRNATTLDLERVSRLHGTKSMHIDGCRFVYEKLTSLQELSRVGV